MKYLNVKLLSHENFNMTDVLIKLHSYSRNMTDFTDKKWITVKGNQ